jgi:hypothetical protein
VYFPTYHCASEARCMSSGGVPMSLMGKSRAADFVFPPGSPDRMLLILLADVPGGLLLLLFQHVHLERDWAAWDGGGRVECPSPRKGHCNERHQTRLGRLHWRRLGPWSVVGCLRRSLSGLPRCKRRWGASVQVYD